MQNRRQHKRTFRATDDHGVSYALHVFVDAANDGSEDKVEIVRTSGGSIVTDLGEGKYKIEATGKILRSNT